jgi:hypothetical protein
MRATNGKKIKRNVIRCDNAGENLSQLSKQLARYFHRNHIMFEFIAHTAPKKKKKKK